MEIKTAGIIMIAYMFIYAVIYRNHKFTGNILFTITSLSILATQDDVTQIVIGVMLTLGSLGNLIIDILRTPINRKE